MFYGIQMRAHGWPRNRSHGFPLEVCGYCSWMMRPGVFIHIHRPCWRLSNGLGYFAHDCKLILVTIQGNLTGDQYIRDVATSCSPPFQQPHTSYKLYFCVSKPSSGRRLHDAETGSRLTNGTCPMSLNSNYVVLSTMPNVIVDIGLPTVNVYWLSR
jgi:hypothetical protein